MSRKGNNQELSLLMRQAQSGNKQAYAQLFQLITPILRGFVYKNIGAGNDNEDIVQEILLAVHKNSATYHSERSFTNWLFAIASHKLNDYLRAYYRHSHVDFLEDEAWEKISDADVTSGGVNANILEQLDNTLLSKISEKQQKIIYLMKVEGFSGKEVAQQLDMSESAVKVAAHRAYATLGKLVNRDTI